MLERDGVLRVRRHRVEERLATLGLLHTLSLARYQLKREVEACILDFANGDVLEAGAGRSPYREALSRVGASVTTLDVDHLRAPDICADVQNMAGVEEGSFDTILSTQVLEHLHSPEAGMREMARVLRPGGILILSAPHLSMVHEAPNDYFRFTQFGLRSLCESAGLAVLAITPVGGPLSFSAHLASSGWMSVVGAWRGTFWFAWILNYALLVRAVDPVDRLMSLPSMLPRDIVVVAEKPGGSHRPTSEPRRRRRNRATSRMASSGVPTARRRGAAKLEGGR